MTGRDKIRTIEEIAEFISADRLCRHKIVQAHGAFDLLHVGHVRHLESSKRLGDVLVVTLTADEFIRKGPGRPVFNAYVRAEMVAALECVDWVAILESPDAVSAIEMIRPDVFVKGQDYENPEGDITGRIQFERDAVEAYGGRIEFTHEMTFSSSSLINQHMNVFEPHVRSYLDAVRNDRGLDEMIELIESVRDYRVLVIGDAIIDEYQYTLPMAKTPKESILATRFQDSEMFAGGVFAAANHVAGFCKEVDVITAIGDDEHEQFIRSNLLPNVNLHVLRRASTPTTRKCRFIDPTQMRKLFEVYVVDDGPLTDDLEVEMVRLIEKLAPEADVTVVTDFGHGLLSTYATMWSILDNSHFVAVNTQSNSANLGYNIITKWPQADYICIDAPEARLATRDRMSPIGDIAHRLLGAPGGDTGCPRLIITQGAHGCVTLEYGDVVHTIPAFAKNVIDTMGAGDAFIAITAPLVAAGGPLNRVGFIGNVVGALKVGIIGHRRPIDKPSLIKAITGLLK